MSTSLLYHSFMFVVFVCDRLQDHVLKNGLIELNANTWLIYYQLSLNVMSELVRSVSTVAHLLPLGHLKNSHFLPWFWLRSLTSQKLRWTCFLVLPISQIRKKILCVASQRIQNKTGFIRKIPEFKCTHAFDTNLFSTPNNVDISSFWKYFFSKFSHSSFKTLCPKIWPTSNKNWTSVYVWTGHWVGCKT